MTITASQVNELRQKTGAGLMDCKKALKESDGDMDAAIEFLRKKGQKVAELRAGKESNEGLVIAQTTDDGKAGAVVYLSSETDFVAKNDDFAGFAQKVADAALENLPASLDELKALEVDGATIEQGVTDLVGKINEKIELTAYEKLEGEGIVAYNHAGNKIGVLVQVNKSLNDDIKAIGRDVAMQVAAMNPVALNEDGVDQAIIDKELEIGREQAVAEGKPENIVDKIATGRLNKFFKENTLLKQAFVKDSSKTVEQVVKDVEGDLKVEAFKRVALGDDE